MSTTDKIKIDYLTRDELVNFMTNEVKDIKRYNFDFFHDIYKIMHFAYHGTNHHYNNGDNIFTEYIWQIRDMGTWLWDISDYDSIAASRRQGNVKKEYRILIRPNCDYLFNKSFAEVHKIN